MGDIVFKTFDVLSLDHKVNDVTSTKLLLSRSKLIITYDDIIEVYNIADLSLSFNDIQPKFDVQGLLLEGNFNLGSSLEQKVIDIRNSENRLIFSIQEENSVPKDILLRINTSLEPNFRTWAMGQTVVNTKNGVANRGVEEMLTGYFTSVNPEMIMKFIFVFVGYFVLKLLTVNFLPGLVDTLIDILFWGVLAFVLYFMYRTAQVNLERYEKVYLSYRA